MPLDIARTVQIIGWALFSVSLLAGLYGVFGGPDTDHYPWLSVCIISWIIAQFVLALARRLAKAAANSDES